MWLNSPDNLILKENEAHIWQADLDISEALQSSFIKLLSSDEKNRANKFRFYKDYRRFIAGRGILRTLIGKYLKIDATEVSFHYGEYGKPSLLKNQSFQFNLSHSKNLALFAFIKEFNIGVDVEYINPNIEIKEIAIRFFSKNEVENLFALPEKQQILGFFNCWTRKEAFIKAVGEGLSFPLDTFEVSLEPNTPAKLLATDWEPKDVSKWSIYSSSFESNFVGSLVVEGFIEKIKCWNWQKN